MSTRRVTHRIGAEWDDIVLVARQLREPERRDFLRHYDSVEEGITAAVQQSRSVYTADLDGSPVGIYGLGLTERIDTLQPWLALTERAERHPVLVLRHARKWLQCYGYYAEQLVNYVPVDDPSAVRFLEAAGFAVDRAGEVKHNGGRYYPFRYSRRAARCAP